MIRVDQRGNNGGLDPTVPSSRLANPLPALLAPVPLRHLLPGQEVCQREGKVAFWRRHRCPSYPRPLRARGILVRVTLSVARIIDPQLREPMLQLRPGIQISGEVTGVITPVRSSRQRLRLSLTQTPKLKASLVLRDIQIEVHR